MEDGMVERQGRVRAIALGRFLHLAFAVTTNLACTHASLEVHSVSAYLPAKVEEPCGLGIAPEECLRSKRPAFEVRIPDVSSVQWARLSADGGFLVASVKTHIADSSGVSSVVAFDLRTHRELWRAKLAGDYLRAAASDCFILPSGVALVIPSGDETDGGLLMLDSQTGAKKWALPSRDLQVLGADEENDFLLTAQGRSINVVDGASGTVLAAKYVALWEEIIRPRIYWTPSAAFIVGSGVTRVARRERRFTWQQRFATYAERGYSSSNLANAFQSMF
jgi:hypothetical protein